MIFIDISHNWISEIPEQISKLTELQFFDCSFNRLVRLPSSLGQLTKLLDLFLQNNRLLYIPEELTRLHRLRVWAASHAHSKTRGSQADGCARGAMCEVLSTSSAWG